MPGIEEDITRALARGMIRTGFHGRAVEYEVYTCPRSGLRLSIPLSNAPYLVHAEFPDPTLVFQCPLVDDAFAMIASAGPRKGPPIEPQPSVARSVPERAPGLAASRAGSGWRRARSPSTVST